ncbi:MAG: type II toxin-antitoxin system RelE/ParE family toxin [Candidatus Marinimicrobia bacterium]|nr:type II toxin-antitoxin system RelE/ParE family toxin [Candidatus Neomarinimicrobiota bacterium]
MEIKFTPTARGMFLDSLLHIEKENPIAAHNFKDKAEKSLRRLIDFPQSGKRIREFPDLPFRENIISPYRFFYRVKNETVWVVAVWHSAQIPKRSTK